MSTLGLNMIIGPGEAKLMKRCLESFAAKDVFDEIVIVNTSNDSRIDEMASYYTDKIFHFLWESERFPYGNFGGARDFARQHSTTDKIMWLDADDVCLSQYSEKWLKTVSLVKDDQHKDIMLWSMPYAIIVDDGGNPTTWFKRERVFDRVKIEWQRPIHEMLYPEWEMVQHAEINGMYITHLPMKPTYSSAVRNVKILEHEYTVAGETDAQTKYFLGRDLMFTGHVARGIALLSEIVDDLQVSYEMLYAICIELVYFYAYGCNNPRPNIANFKKENMQQIEGWCRLAIAFAPEYAEPCVILGDAYWYKGAIDSSLKLYTVAMGKKLGVGKFQSTPFYCEIPAERLARVYTLKRNFGLALHYNRIALQMNKELEYIHVRKEIIQLLIEEVHDEFGQN